MNYKTSSLNGFVAFRNINEPSEFTFTTPVGFVGTLLTSTREMKGCGTSSSYCSVIVGFLSANFTATTHNTQLKTAYSKLQRYLPPPVRHNLPKRAMNRIAVVSFGKMPRHHWAFYQDADHLSIRARRPAFLILLPYCRLTLSIPSVCVTYAKSGKTSLAKLSVFEHYSKIS